MAAGGGTMNQTHEQYLRGVMDGSNRSVRAAFLRLATRCAEPFYAGAMRLRNLCFNLGIFASHSLCRPTISVGNITTGGTGKTPVVQWLAQSLATAGHKPAILLRGYKSTANGISDEAAALQSSLKSAADGPIPVIADPDRIRGAFGALQEHPQISLFLLDDAMQHRRARRNFELVLIHAAEPFGYSHVLPRGMLREPLSGLGRADAFLITHAHEVPQIELEKIETVLRQHNTDAPIYHCDHLVSGFRSTADERHPAEYLAGKRFFAFCGIGSPMSFLHTLDKISPSRVGTKLFPDHHEYTAQDLTEVVRLAQSNRAELLITTEKDWAKLSNSPYLKGAALPIFRAQLSLQFAIQQDRLLLDQIAARLASQ